MSENFSEKLRRLRTERGITQQQLASMMYIDRSTIARWESGTRLPDLVLLPRLAKCLGVEVSHLIPDEDPSGPAPVVIIVDDEPLILSGELKTLCEVLPSAEITGFSSPAQALDFALNNRITLAFLDIEMGKVNGFDICKKLLSINPTTRVIYLTAFPDYALKAWDTGARGFLVKPLDARDITEQLRRLNLLPQCPENRDGQEARHA